VPGLGEIEGDGIYKPDSGWFLRLAPSTEIERERNDARFEHRKVSGTRLQREAKAEYRDQVRNPSVGGLGASNREQSA
jgi:hypothetical protein